MRSASHLWFFLLGPFVFNFFAYMLSWWFGYVVTGSYESAWKVAYVYRAWIWMGILWVFFCLLIREFRFEGLSFKNVVGMKRDLIVADVLLGIGLLLLSLLSWNLYMVPWALVWSEFLAFFEEFPLTMEYVALVVMSSFTAGVVEELIWRGYGISKLEERYRSTRKAVVFSAITWAVYHIDPFHIGIVFIFGVIYGYLFVKLRRLSPLIMGHTAFDIVGFAFPRLLTMLVS